MDQKDLEWFKRFRETLDKQSKEIEEFLLSLRLEKALREEGIQMSHPQIKNISRRLVLVSSQGGGP